jgi:DtxR family Mn-dependent transcriptional regulator
LKAKEIVRKHQVLKRFFVQVLSLDEEIAEDNACRLEHHLDPRVIDKLVDFVDYAQMCPVDQTRWINGVAEDCEDCMKCLEEAKKRVLAKEKARRKALESGLTMVEAPPGAQVIVETFKGDPYDISTISKGMVEEGAMVEMEENSPDSESVLINIRGYQISLPRNLASEILVKPA